MNSKKLDKKFTAVLQKSEAKGGWTYVVMPSDFCTRGLMKVRVTVDLYSGESTARS
jgi:Domain of unknown function (DUF1905)